MKIYSFYAWVALSMILFLGGCTHSSYLETSDPPGEAAEQEEQEPDDTIDKEEEETAQEARIFVQVAGFVKKPGVYELPQDARVFEAVDMAGGLKKGADDKALNLAESLSDGQKIYVYKKGEMEEIEASIGSVATGGVEIGESAAGGSLVNLNTADLSQLLTLPGVGDVKAQAIISFREANGGFKSVDDLKNVSGIGDATVQKLKEYVTI